MFNWEIDFSDYQNGIGFIISLVSSLRLCGEIFYNRDNGNEKLNVLPSGGLLLTPILPS